MLIFKNGTWQDVELPVYVDPSWGVKERSAAAYMLASGKAWSDVEAAIYLSVLGKEHSRPENSKKEGGV